MNRKECVSKPRMPWPLTWCNCLQAANSNPQTPEQERMARQFGSLPGNPSPCGWHRRPQRTCFVYPAANSAWHRVGTWAMCGKQRVSKRREEGKGCLPTRASWVLGTEATWSPAGVPCTSAHTHAQLSSLGGGWPP